MRILSGIQPSGTLHLGNYFGMMRPAIELQEKGEAFYFIADYHSMTSLFDPNQRRKNSLAVALDFLACGLDPKKSVFFSQSDLPETGHIVKVIDASYFEWNLSVLLNERQVSSWIRIRGSSMIPAPATPARWRCSNITSSALPRHDIGLRRPYGRLRFSRRIVPLVGPFWAALVGTVDSHHMMTNLDQGADAYACR